MNRNISFYALFVAEPGHVMFPFDQQPDVRAADLDAAELVAEENIKEYGWMTSNQHP